MANATKRQVGRSVGHERAVFMATSGHFCWPPMGSSDWPLTVIDSGADLITPSGIDLRWITVCILVNTESKHASSLKALIRGERVARLDVVRQLRCHASSVRRRADISQKRASQTEAVALGGALPCTVASGGRFPHPGMVRSLMA